MAVEIPGVRVLHQNGSQLYSLTGLMPRYPKIGEQVSLNNFKYRVVDVRHIIEGIVSPVAQIHVIVRDEITVPE